MTKPTVSAAGGAVPEINPLINNDRLITVTGEVDHAFIQLSARARAQSLYGTDCRESDVAYWVEKLTGMADMLASKLSMGLKVWDTPAAPEAAKAAQPIKVASRYLIVGDLTGSDECVLSVSAGVRTPRGKVEVTLEKAGRRRMSVWGASTIISVRRAAQ